LRLDIHLVIIDQALLKCRAHNHVCRGESDAHIAVTTTYAAR